MKKRASHRLTASEKFSRSQLQNGENSLRSRLEVLVSSYGKEHLSSDPALFAHRYHDPLDQEIVAFIAASLAYGNVKQIRASVENALSRLGDSPRRFVERFDPVRDMKKLDGFFHRFNQSEDLACLIFFMKQAVRAHGSLGEFFAVGWKREPTIRESAISWVQRLEAQDLGPFYGGRLPSTGKGVRFFLSSPQEGSACKRLCMFLRWMVRKDEVDLGLWPQIPTSALIMPIDTHIARIAHALELIHLPNASWKIAEELTASLRRFDANDPVKYDFALSRIGILEGWPRRDPQHQAAKRVVELFSS